MRKLSVSLLAGVLLLSSAGFGAPPSAADVARASKLADDGKKLFKDEKWAEAYEKFKQADQAVHNPTMVLQMARCKRKLGELAEARALYDRVAAEKLEDDAPDRWVKAQVDAKAEGADLAKKVPVLVLTAQGDGVAQLVVEVDGKGVAVGSGPVRLTMNPGTHTVKSTTPWGGTQTQPVTLTEGAETPLVLKAQRPLTTSPTGTATVTPPPTAATGAGSTPEPTSTVSAPPTASHAPVTPVPPTSGPGPFTWVAFSAGGAGLLVGAITGGVALSEGSQGLKSCAVSASEDGSTNVRRCYPNAEPHISTAKSLGLASTIAFAAGAAGVAAGVTLLLTSGAGANSPAPTGKVTLKVGPAWIGVEGDF